MMVEEIGEAAIYEGISEEASELASAAAKMGRILRGDNPAGISKSECESRVITELTHLLMYCCDICLFPNNVIAKDTLNRFNKRIYDKKNSHEHA